MMKVGIGNDHAGAELKMEIVKHLDEIGVDYIDYGVAVGEKIDYPDAAEMVCKEVINGTVDRAILICGTGIGISIAANKINGIRACACSDAFSAKYTRLHNDANALCLGGRVVGAGLANELVDIFLTTDFEGGRHQRRVDLITKLEEKNRVKEQN
ncbi:MAG: ribose 5-phosphate isomerase B [Oscillospiraceae bacterium]|nr:ribose 5-phosphate isomerase B [Oscillospiraceae bacterium]